MLDLPHEIKNNAVVALSSVAGLSIFAGIAFVRWVEAQRLAKMASYQKKISAKLDCFNDYLTSIDKEFRPQVEDLVLTALDARNFCCSISGEVMLNPVSCPGSYGSKHIFEKAAITAWLTKKQRDPLNPDQETTIWSLKPEEEFADLITQSLEQLAHLLRSPDFESIIRSRNKALIKEKIEVVLDKAQALHKETPLQKSYLVRWTENTIDASRTVAMNPIVRSGVKYVWHTSRSFGRSMEQLHGPADDIVVGTTIRWR
jgi:hypothetical protein